METKQIENMKTKQIEVLDLTNYTNKEINSIKEGYEIWCSGCLGGSWEDEEFYELNNKNTDYLYFEEVFGNTDLFGGVDILRSDYPPLIETLHNTFKYGY
jgi:hypothetical protein